MIINLSYSIAGSDVIAYDWNPVNGTRGNLLVTLSIVIVTSREEFNFSSKYTYTNTHTHSLTNTYLLLHYSLVITNKVNTNLCRAQIQTIIIYLYSLILQNSVFKKAILISSVCPQLSSVCYNTMCMHIIMS